MKRTTPLSRVLLPSLLVLVLLLAACGGAASPTATSAPPTTELTDVPPTVEATEEPTAQVTEELTEEATDEADATEEATDDADATEEAEATAEAAAGVPSAETPMVRIEQQTTGLRAGPGVTSERVGSANSGDLLPVIGKSGTGQSLWYQVELPDGSIGWVWSTVATLLPADAEVPEVEPS